MDDCVASCFDFGNASAEQEARDDSPVSCSDAGTLVNGQPFGNADDVHRGSSKGFTSTANTNSIDVEQMMINDEAHQDEGSVVESAQSNVFFFGGALATTMSGMAMAVFIALLGGEAGLHFSFNLVWVLNFGMVDVALRIDERHLTNAEPPPNTPTLLKKLCNRVICWIALGIARGVSYWFRSIPMDPKRFGEEWWQLKPSLRTIFSNCQILFIARVMWQTHRDNRPNIWRLQVFGCVCFTMHKVFRAFALPTHLPYLHLHWHGFPEPYVWDLLCGEPPGSQD